MTRKRFVKLLMSIGYDRNTANLIAWGERLRRSPYEKVWREYKYRYSVKLAFEKLGSGLDKVGVAATRFVEQLKVFGALLKEQERTHNG